MPSSRIAWLAGALLALTASICHAQRGDYRPSEGGFRGGDGSFRGGVPGGGYFQGGGPSGTVRIGPGGGPPSGGFPGGGFNPGDMLRQADTNRNGLIDFSEMQGRMGEFARRMAERAGLNTNAPLPIDRLTAGLDSMRRDQGSDRDRDRDRERDRERSSSSSGSGSPLPPDAALPFSVSAAMPKLPGFDVPLGASSQVPIEQRFDRRILERAREMLRDRDRNRNGMIERAEWEGHRWDPPADQSDLNKDGILTLEEICLRYQARESSSASRGSGGPSAGPSSPRPVIMAAPGSPGGSSGSGDQGRFMAEMMLRRSDRNGDGKLQRDEWSSVRDAESADANNDGIITVDEMAARVQSFGGGRMMFAGGPGDRDRGSSGDRERVERGPSDRGSESRGNSGERGGSNREAVANSQGNSRSSSSSANSAPPKRSYRLATPSEQLPSDLPSWFKDSDANGDGQISMPEYRRRSSVKENVEEFLKIDANSDGLITPEECLDYEG